MSAELHCILASSNAHKAEEFAKAFEGLSFRCIAAPESLEVEESGSSFFDNARLKAWAYAERWRCHSLADDSGLSVFALGLAPGVHSARYASDWAEGQGLSQSAANMQKLLVALAGLKGEERRAYFSCVLCLAFWPSPWLKMLEIPPALASAWRVWDAEGRVYAGASLARAQWQRAELCVEGRVEGLILEAPVGEAGFGYDPIFYHPGLKASFAELSQAEKLAVSHRGQAIVKLREHLAYLL